MAGLEATMQNSNGNSLRRLREAKGLTQRTLAGRAGLYLSHYRKLETGQVLPLLATARKLAAALGTHVDVIFPDQEA